MIFKTSKAQRNKKNKSKVTGHKSKDGGRMTDGGEQILDASYSILVKANFSSQLLLL